MTHPYAHLLSPLQVGKTVFKNRIFSAPMGLHALQGGEPYPTEAIIKTFSNKARGGAAVVTCHGAAIAPVSNGAMLAYDITKKHNQHYLAALAEGIHFYDAKASMEIAGSTMMSFYRKYQEEHGLEGIGLETMPDWAMKDITDQYAVFAELCQKCGFDMCLIHMAYDAPTGGKYLSKHYNQRQDSFGGSTENRVRYPMMLMDRIKERCGKDFLIELRMSGMEPQFDDGIRLEDTIEVVKLLKGHADIFQIHGGDALTAHPTGFMPPLPFRAWAGKVKEAVPDALITTIGGYQDLREADDTVRSGVADFIGIGRGMIAEPELGRKAYVNRSEDVTPCIKCMRCHDSACIDHKTYRCSVNPEIGLEHKVKNMIVPTQVQRIAVIGGGPSGMSAAVAAADRGHQVTLFEKEDALGGQLKFADYASFKYSLKKYTDYLIRQVEKRDITLRLGTAATPEMIAAEGYDAVFVAIGADPLVPPIPGVDGENVIMAPDVFGHETKLGESVVVIGGGQVGCETGLHLALSGHKVTILEMKPELAPDASFSYRKFLLNTLKENPDITVITGAQCTGISRTVNCRTENGVLQFAADTVVIAAGMRPKQAEAYGYYGSSVKTVLIGDCSGLGTVEKATRTGYAAAVTV